MKLRTTLASLAAATALVATISAAALSEAPATASTPTLDQIKALAGEWVLLDEEGQPTEQVISRYRVTAGGSAVLEILFPETEKEMVTVYHQDGDELILTHYCMLGNQPRMRALREGDTSKELTFRCDGHGTNMASENDAHMHQGTIRFLGKDRITTEWQMYEDGHAHADHQVELPVARVKKAGAR